MKMRVMIGLVALMMVSGCVVYDAPPPRVGVTVGASVSFYAPLALHGAWVEVGGYGRCWHPAGVAAGWRPYVNGHWVWTDAGWYWASDEVWGWATYHYGRWSFTSRYGWVWVPGNVWGPSWVAWREGGGYVGWAPLSPECRFGSSGVLVFEERFLAPTSFVFVETRRVCEPIRPTVVVYNQTIINKTVNITNINQVNNVVIVQGPKVEVIEKVSAKKVPTARVTELRVHEEKQSKSTAKEEKAKPAKTEAGKPVTEAKGKSVKPQKPAKEEKNKPVKDETGKIEKEKPAKKKKPAEEEGAQEKK